MGTSAERWSRIGHNIITWLAVMHLVSRQLGQQEQKELKLRNTLKASCSLAAVTGRPARCAGRPAGGAGHSRQVEETLGVRVGIPAQGECTPGPQPSSVGQVATTGQTSWFLHLKKEVYH